MSFLATAIRLPVRLRVSSSKASNLLMISQQYRYCHIIRTSTLYRDKSLINQYCYCLRYKSTVSTDEPKIHLEIKSRDTKVNYNTPKAEEPSSTAETSFKFITERDRHLAQTTTLFEKLKINIRWFLTKSTRPLKIKAILATFVSGVVVSNLLIVLFWTTSFFSIIIYLLNTVLAQEYVARKVGNFLTKNTALSVVFESAIVPDWSSGKISFNKVFVSRRPKLAASFTKGSQKDAMQRAELALREGLLVNRQDFDEGNYTQLDITIERLEISLSLSKWLNGKGILDEVSINGLRGVVDRTHVYWKPTDDPRDFLNVHHPGDFEISRFIMNDVLFTLYQPDKFRPFQVSIFNCDLPQLRKHWLYYDILNATTMSGTYDDSMFTIHKRLQTSFEPDGTSSSPWRRVTRCRVDNLDIDHLNAGMNGPFGWITEGQVDMIGDILLPDNEADPNQLSEILTEIGDRLFKEAVRYSYLLSYPPTPPAVEEIDPNQYFIMDFFLKLHNVRAEVPLYSEELGYINGALIRPIVGYINSKRTYIPIKCRVVKNISDFEGSWTVYDSLLMNDLSAEVYDAFAEYVADDRKRTARIKQVGFWSLQLILQVVLMSLSAIA